jgi:hypothetical protein
MNPYFIFPGSGCQRLGHLSTLFDKRDAKESPLFPLSFSSVFTTSLFYLYHFSHATKCCLQIYCCKEVKEEIGSQGEWMMAEERGKWIKESERMECVCGA